QGARVLHGVPRQGHLLVADFGRSGATGTGGVVRRCVSDLDRLEVPPSETKPPYNGGFGKRHRIWCGEPRGRQFNEYWIPSGVQAISNLAVSRRAWPCGGVEVRGGLGSTKTTPSGSGRSKPL